MWSLNLGWDEIIIIEDQKIWSNLAENLENLSSLSFPRYSVDKDSPMNLCIFCDESSYAYGFVAYRVQNTKASILFSKAKIAPMKPKTLPPLELLGVHLAVKCLPTLLGVYSHIKIDNIYLSVDAQVVLSWIFSDNFKTKSLYTRNRIKDIHQMIKEIDSKYSIKIHFKYVTFSENPADLLSRGIPFEKFQQNLTYWTCGPNWLSENPLKWPDNNLNCLNAANKDIIQSINLHNTATYPKLKPMIPFERFSKLTKLIKATAFVSKFIDKCKHNKDCLESDHITKLYLSKVMQEQTFFKEIAYIKILKKIKLLI